MENADKDFLGPDGLLGSSKELRKRCRMTSKVHYNTEELSGYVFDLGQGAGLGSSAAWYLKKLSTGKTFVGLSLCVYALEYSLLWHKRACHHEAGARYGALERKTCYFEHRVKRVLNTQPSKVTEFADKLYGEMLQLEQEKKDLDAKSPLAPETVKWYTKWALNRANKEKSVPLDK